jgi:hypothetical protein
MAENLLALPSWQVLSATYRIKSIAKLIKGSKLLKTFMSSDALKIL